MEIKINKLTIDNFKGIRHAELTLGGVSNEIAGDNGTGKSTVFDAFTWLLFGKDHRGQSASGTSGFNITPIDPATREEIHHADTSVEAELTLDGTVKTLRRVWKEDWVKPKGKAEAVLAGHSGSFWSDGVELPTKKDYDAIISQMIDENIFKAMTDPLYLIGGQTHWKELRGMLLGLAGDEIDRSRLEGEFADLLAEMNGEPLDQFRKRVAAAKKKCREVLDSVEPTVRGMMKARPEKEDFDALRAELAAAEDRIKEDCAPAQARMAEIDRLLEGEKARAEAGRERLSELYRRQTDIRMRQEKMLAAVRQEAMAANNRRAVEVQEKTIAVTNAKNLLARFDAEADVRGKQERIAALDDDICKASEKVRALREAYTQEREKAMEIGEVDTRCPACGQELPAETIEEARRHARALAIDKKRRDLQTIVDEANALKRGIEASKTEIDSLKCIIEQKVSRRAEFEEAVGRAETALSGVLSTPMINSSDEELKCRKSPEFAELLREEQTVNSDLLDAKGAAGDESGNAALLTERRGLENQVRGIIDVGYARIADLKARIAREAEIARIDAAIAKEKEDARAMSDELARLERLEFRTEEYVRADIGMVEDVVNNRFRVARFRMFDQTQDGGLVETCYVTDAKGVPFRSMNDAQRILCGLDVIRVLGEHYGVSAPIFVDNAESVTTRDFGTQSQVIALTVVKGVKNLHVSVIG